MSRTNVYSEDLRLIEDLEMDSIDTYELIYNTCSELGIAEPDFDSIRFNTLKDIIDSIYRVNIK